MATPPSAPQTKAIGNALAKPVSVVDQFINQLSQDHAGVAGIVIAAGLRVLAAIAILAAAWLLGKFLFSRLQNLRHLDQTLRTFLGLFLKYIIMTVALVTVIGLFGIPMASLLAVMGAAGLAIGLALQGTLSNVAAGVMILVLRPFKVGDYIDYSSGSGTVRVVSVGLFGTELANVDNVFIYTPNSKIWGGSDIKNYSRNAKRRMELKFSVKTDIDADKAASIMTQALKNDDRLIVDDGHKPEVVVDGVAAGTTTLVVRFWCKTGQADNVRSAMNTRIRDQLKKQDVALA